MNRLSISICLTVVVLAANPVLADDVAFTLVEKNASFRAGESGEPELVHYEFVSETLLYRGGMIHGGTIREAEGEKTVFSLKESSSFYNRYADVYQDFKQLDKKHPNGEYVVDISGANNDISNLRLAFHGPEGLAQLPDVITIELLQEGNEKALDQIDPALPLKVVWSNFAKGNADPRGIMDDLVFAMVNDCHGKSVSRSGIPFIMPDYYTFRDQQHIVPAGKLQPGQGYTVKVIHVNGVDTKKMGETVAMATYNTSTAMEFHTTGDNNSESACPAEAEQKD